MATHIQTGNMLDVVVDGKSIGLKQRDSDRRKYEVIWLPDPEALAMALMTELRRIEEREAITSLPPVKHWNAEHVATVETVEDLDHEQS